MFAILMIVLNGLAGMTLVIGAVRHGQQHYNLQGAIAFLAVIVPLAVFTLVLPKFTQSTDDPTFTREQATVFALLTMLLNLLSRAKNGLNPRLCGKSRAPSPKSP